MVRADSDKMLGANLPREFVDNFWDNAAPEGTNKTLIIKAMALLWLDLPDDVKQSYLYPKTGEKSLNILIQQIVQSQLEVFRSVLNPAQRKIVDQKLKETKEKIGRKK